MEIIEKVNVKKYLEMAQELKQNNIFFDCHCHPFDIFFHQLAYHKNKNESDVISLNNKRPEKPKISSIQLNEEMKQHPISSSLTEKFFLVKIKRIYGHTGRKIFEHQKELSLIDKVLLLPVALSNDFLKTELKKVFELFGGSESYMIAGSIPLCTIIENILDVVDFMVSEYSIKAIKIHPPLMDIDFSKSKNIEWIENTLGICSVFELPIVVHSGKSFLVRNQKAVEYGSIHKFENVNWRLNKQTVVLAHAGAFGCNSAEIQDDIIPVLKKILDSNNNVMVDISGLGYDSLITILRGIGSERILFGSDALYYPQWSALVMLIAALDELNCNVEKEFLQIVSKNPKRFIFNG